MAFGCLPCSANTLPHGFRMKRFVQPRLAWGVPSRVTGRSGVYHSGDLVKSEATNSSTTKGP